jgi:translocation and assembly module TamA
MRPAAAPLRALAGFVMAALLGGCSSLPFLSHDDEADKTAAAREPEVALYEFDVEAPAPLKKLLLDYLDLARFQKAPKSEAISGPELGRLAAAAPTQARALLETEGYFEADVKVAQSVAAGDLPRIVVTVVPGPRVTVSAVSIEATDKLAGRAPTRDEPSTDRLTKLRRDWALRTGQPFRQPAWSSAKNATLAELRADGYPTASWKSTHAGIDAVAGTAALEVVVEPGPLYRLGAIRIEGTSRYDSDAVRRLATFFPGDIYSEKTLLDYQERLVKVGLFEGASVELDATGAPDSAPVNVKVTELSRHQATFGIGYSANTGPRVSVEHFDRSVFGQPWIAHSTLSFGPDLKSIGSEIASYPSENMWRNLVGANVERLRSADELRDSWSARVGRSQDTTRFERLYDLELAHARVDSSAFVDSATAVSANYHWLRRDLDSVLVPTDGSAISAQVGLGYGKGSETRVDLAGEAKKSGPFVRAYTRLTAYRPFGGWYANARLEAGEVFVTDRIAVPDTTLFRAGGDDSVRGYDYRTLGPRVNGAVVGGRVLLTGSVEVEHALTERVPALLGAIFLDAGNAADRWAEYRPFLGYGVGLHYRSPVGPLRLDLAYGQHVERLRVHVSVGVNF